jgi:hypothetical protein
MWKAVGIAVNQAVNLSARIKIFTMGNSPAE